MSEFAGFGPDLVAFLEDLRFHNEREWFQANKARYEASVREPGLAFIEAMAPRLAKISPEMTAVAKKSGGSMMRIYRDLRFARDAAPYKTNLGIQFRHRAGKDVHAPGFYLHVEPGEAFLGAGVYRPASAPLRQIRQAIVDRPDAWRAVLADRGFAGGWALGGESLSRAPRGFDKAHPLIEDIKRKDFIAIRDLDESEILGPGFVDQAARQLEAAGPLMRFLCQALGLAY